MKNCSMSFVIGHGLAFFCFLKVSISQFIVANLKFFLFDVFYMLMFSTCTHILYFGKKCSEKRALVGERTLMLL